MSSGDIHDRTTAEDDPWRYGWRFVQKVNAEGSEELEQVPLTLEDVLYPEVGDCHMHTPAHGQDCTYLFTVLREHLAARSDAAVFCDNRIDWGAEGVRPLGPDVAVFFHVGPYDPKEGTFYVGDHDSEPVLVIEVTSVSTRVNDVGPKVDLYWRAGVPLYIVADIAEEGRGEDEQRVTAFRRGATGYEPIVPDARGRIALTPLPLWIRLRDGRVALEDAAGKRIGDYTEIARQAREERQRADHIERELEGQIEANREAFRLREEAAALVAEEARLRLAEAARREEVEEKLRLALAELEKLRGAS